VKRTYNKHFSSESEIDSLHALSTCGVKIVYCVIMVKELDVYKSFKGTKTAITTLPIKNNKAHHGSLKYSLNV
jgi:hypothetical protein